MLSKPKSVVARRSNDFQLDRSGASRYDWIQEQMKTLSTHAEIAKAFSYILKQWNALNAFIRNGQVKIDNNIIAENALRGVYFGAKTGCSQALIKEVKQWLSSIA